MSKVDQKHPDLQPKSRNIRNLTLKDIWHVVRCHPAASVLIPTIAICHKTQLMTGWPFAKTRSTSSGPKALLFANNNCPVSRPSTNQRKDPVASLSKVGWTRLSKNKAAATPPTPTPHMYIHSLPWQCPTVSLIQLILKGLPSVQSQVQVGRPPILQT